MKPAIDPPVDVALKPKRKRSSRTSPIPEAIMDDVLEGQNKIMEQVKRNAPKRSGIFAKVFDGTASLRTAIKAKCLECTGFTSPEVANCRVYTCPLWRYRPYSKVNQEQS